MRYTMTPAGRRARADELAGAWRARIAAEPAAHRPELLCVDDERGRLLGTLEPAALWGVADDTPLRALAHAPAVAVTPETEPEVVATLALRHRQTAVPVIDGHGRAVGVIGALALLRILRSEHVADLHRLAGMSREDEQARSALEAPPLRRARHRLPWLVVGLLGSMLATAVVAGFEATLARLPAAAFFIPGLVYMADAIGTQSEAVAVRGLSLARQPIGQLVGGELRTGLLIGLTLAAVAFPAVAFVFGHRMALAVTLALAAACSVATVLGLLLPWLIGRLGFDPAFGSGPLATIVQDLLSLLIYFGTVVLVVPP